MSEELKIITIYENPKDYPNLFVAREFFVGHNGEIKPGKVIGTANSLDDVRKTVPDYLFRMDRSVTDEPHIVESWI